MSARTPRTPLTGRVVRLAVVGLLVVPVMALALGLGTGVGVAIGTATPAEAQCAPRLSVSKASGLATGGEMLTVSGSCYDVDKGVYVAFCVVPPAGSVPSPCGGGVDMSGAGGLSHWISSNPPPAGVGLAVPYGPGGSFTVTMRPTSTLNPTVDCVRVRCAIVTRNDHTRSSDRSQDVIVPVSFAAPAPPPPTTAAPVAPTTAPPTTAAPETTTTVAPETTTTTAPPEVVDDTLVTTAGGGDEGGDDDGSEGLAADTVADQSDSGGSAAPLVIAVVLVVLAAGIGGGWFALRHRDGGDPGATP
jgi:hypothetical protein